MAGRSQPDSKLLLHFVVFPTCEVVLKPENVAYAVLGSIGSTAIPVTGAIGKPLLTLVQQAGVVQALLVTKDLATIIANVYTVWIAWGDANRRDDVYPSDARCALG